MGLTDEQEEILENISDSLKRIADSLEQKWHIDIDHGHIDDIGQIHGDVTTHPKPF